MIDVELSNERFLKILSFYLYSADKMIEKESFEAVRACGVSDSEAFAILLAEGLGVDTEEEKEFFRSYFIQSVKALETSDYTSDEYYKAVAFDGEKRGDCELKYLTEKAFQGFVRDDFKYFEDGRVVPRIGFFKEDYRYPAVLKGGVEWMTLLPNEINSQKRYIEEAFGSVLCYGLGLGYYIFHIAKKATVKKVVCVDIDGEIIELFKTCVLPKFPQYIADKITIIKADAFEYAKKLKDGEFDYIYADIWRDVSDGKDLFLKFKALEKFSPKSKFGYWIEDTIKYYL